MPIAFTTDHARRRIHAVATGALDYPQVHAHVLARHAAGVLAYDQVLDLRLTTALVTAEETTQLAQEMRTLCPTLGQTVMVASPGLLFGLARQTAAYADIAGHAVHVVTTIEAADQLLDELRSSPNGAPGSESE